MNFIRTAITIKNNVKYYKIINTNEEIYIYIIY